MQYYYNKRHGLMPENEMSVSLEQLQKFWKETYDYFKTNGFLQLAEAGVENVKSKLALKMAPSPEQFLFTHTGRLNLYPITIKKLNECSESDTFTLIEIYYNQVEECKWETNEDDSFSWHTKSDEPRRIYATYVNNILRFYKSGFYLEPTLGFIMPLPNEALKHQLKSIDEAIPDDVYQKLSEATKNYYRFDANIEGKRKAIASLADILESIREDLKNLFNEEYGIAKATHDNSIFQIVNNYCIRHNNKKQCSNYSTEIWFDWMMQNYTSVIIAFYRLLSKKRMEQENG